MGTNLQIMSLQHSGRLRNLYTSLFNFFSYSPFLFSDSIFQHGALLVLNKCPRASLGKSGMGHDLWLSYPVVLNFFTVMDEQASSRFFKMRFKWIWILYCTVPWLFVFSVCWFYCMQCCFVTWDQLLVWLCLYIPFPYHGDPMLTTACLLGTLLFSLFTAAFENSPL